MEARSARRPQAASRLIGLDDYLKRQSWVLARQLGECSFWIYMNAAECLSYTAFKSQPIRAAYFTCCKMFIYRSQEAVKRELV